MAMKSHRWFRRERKHSDAGRRTGPHGVKPRRLIVERIEDRLLLSAGYQTGIEAELDNVVANNNGAFVVVYSDLARQMTSAVSVSFRDGSTESRIYTGRHFR